MPSNKTALQLSQGCFVLINDAHDGDDGGDDDADDELAAPSRCQKYKR